MRLLMTTLLAAAISASGCALSSAGSTSKPPVACTPPLGLREVLSKAHPGAHVVAQADLVNEHQVLFRKDHGDRCPGMVRVDLYGDGKPTWALVLLEGTAANRRAQLVLARQLEEGWVLATLDDAEAAIAPVVWSEGPGRYEDVYGERVLVASSSVIVFAGYESWAIVYSWNGRDVEKVWIAD